MAAWKFVKVAPMRVTASAVGAYGDYVSRRDPERQLEPEATMQTPVDDLDLDVDAEPETLEDWVKQKNMDQEYVYTAVLNPGEGRVPLEQSAEWTRRTFERVEQRHDLELDYRFWVHDDQHSHVHAVLSSPRELSPEELRDFRFQAGRAWQEIEPDYPRTPEPELTIGNTQARELEQQLELQRHHQQQQLELERAQRSPDYSI
jgi:hypothetical protein